MSIYRQESAARRADDLQLTFCILVRYYGVDPTQLTLRQWRCYLRHIQKVDKQLNPQQGAGLPMPMGRGRRR